MARTSKKAVSARHKEAWENEVCDTCQFSKWNTIWWNISIYDKKPITMHCPHRGKGIFGGTKACQQYCKEPGKPTREEMTFTKEQITYDEQDK